MLTVRVLPRQGVTLRAAVATVEVTGALALGHLWAGGSLPSPVWLAVMAAAVLGTGMLVLHGRVRPLVAVPALVATQLLLHAWLTALTMGPDPTGHAMPAGHAMVAMPAMHAGHEHALLDPRMLAVHVGGGLLTALLWELRARAVEVLVTWSRTPLPPLPTVRRVPTPVVVPSLTAAHAVRTAPRRGPPLGLAVA